MAATFDQFLKPPHALMAHLYLWPPIPLEFKRLFPHLTHSTACARSRCNQEDALFLHSIRSQQLATLAARVSAADEATPELLSGIVAETARRLSAPDDAAQLHQLIEAGALTEAAFAVINLELPLWQIRRITYDEGEWHCAMCRQRELPEWLDEAIETTHASLTLAIVSVYIETLRQIEASREPSRPSVSRTRDDQFKPVCCDNFA